MWILLKQETVSGSGIRWVICMSALRSTQGTMPVPRHSVFYKPAGDGSRKPGGRLPLLSAGPAVTLATLKRAATNFAAW